jgi:NhaA family Na+:H+ antiporter
MATDIAFALGCLSLVKGRVPTSVFVFLTALAIFDDLGAIAVIAFFYGGAIDADLLVVALCLTGVLVGLGRARVQAMWPYVVVGLLLWVTTLNSGIHATIAGVVVGLALPTVPRHAPREVLDELDVAITSLRRDCDSNRVAAGSAITAIERHVESVYSPLDRATHALHGVVAFGIVPLFALANAGVALRATDSLASQVTLGAFLGLVVGKPVGVLGATWLATRVHVAERPTGATFTQLLGASLMAGIGFTMSLLVGNLGLGATRGLEDEAKIGVLAASFLSALLGLLVFLKSPALPKAERERERPLVLDVPRFARGYGVAPCEVAGPLLGNTLAEVDLRRRFGVTVIGFWHGGEPSATRKLEPISPEHVMQAGDVLLVAGADEAVEGLLQLVRPKDSQRPPKG